MIKFFRKIRNDIMEKNKTGKYMIYTIGDIALDVIGKLIALQINNWNEARKNQQKELYFLKGIRIGSYETASFLFFHTLPSLI